MKWIEGGKRLFPGKKFLLHFIVLDDNNFLQVFPDHSPPQLLDLCSFLGKLENKPKILLYLSSPFLESFVHETICLKSKELSSVDQTIHFRRPVSNVRSLISISTGGDRATTIHSHLSEAGQNLITKLQTQGCKTVWRPLVREIIKNSLLYPANTEEHTQFVLLLFFGEALRLDNRTLQSKVHYVPFWRDPANNMEQQAKSNLLFGTNHENYTLRINLVPKDLKERLQQNSQDIHPLYKFIFPSSKKKRIKTVNYTSNRKGLPLTSMNLTKIFSAMIVMLGIWATIVFYQTSELKAERSRLQSELQKFEGQPALLQQISHTQEQLFQFKAILEATQSMNTDPENLFTRITALLPDGVWLEKLSINYERITLEILDRQGTELSTLIEGFNTNIGKTNIDHNEKTDIQEHSLRRYGMNIQRKTNKSGNEPSI